MTVAREPEVQCEAAEIGGATGQDLECRSEPQLVAILMERETGPSAKDP
jgi:hypothetical protein